MKSILVAFVLTRLLLFAAAGWSVHAEPCREYDVPGAVEGTTRRAVVPWHEDPEVGPYQVVPIPCLDGFARHDALKYLAIAGYGYTKNAPPTGAGEPEPSDSAGFFPGYPVLVRLAALIIWPIRPLDAHLGYPDPLAGILAATLATHVCLLLAAFALRRLALRVTDPTRATLAGLLLLLHPFALFGSTLMSEAPYILFTTLALEGALSGREFRATFFGGLAAFTRPTGILIAIPIAIAACECAPEGASRWRRLVWLPLVAAGTGAVLLWHQLVLGSFTAWLDVQRTLGHGGFPTLHGILDLFRTNGVPEFTVPRNLIQIVATLAAAVCTGALWRHAPAGRGRLALVTWAALSVVIPLLSDSLLSIPRYVYAAVPITLGAALAAPRGGVGRVLATICTGAQLVGLVLFARGWPILI